MIKQKLLYNTALLAQLPCLARHSFKKKHQVLFLISLLRNLLCLMREEVDERDERDADGFEPGDRIGDAAIEVKPRLFSRVRYSECALPWLYGRAL